MGGKNTTSSQQVTIPPEVLARYNSVNATAEQAAATPFQTYNGEFVAPLSPSQMAGIANTNTAAGQAQPYYQAGTSALLQSYGAAQPFNYGAAGLAAASSMPINAQPLNIGRYMSPYLGTVLGSEEALLNQQNQQQMSGQLGNAIMSNAFGGDRAGIAAANLAQQQQLANSNIYGGILNQGFNTALQTAQQQQGLNLSADQANRAALLAASQGLLGAGSQIYGQGLGAAQGLAGLGAGAQGAALQGAQAQMAAGQQQQATQQAQDTALYNQFLQQQSYPFQTAQFLANIAEGTGQLSGTTTTTTQPGGFFSDVRLKENIEPIGKTHDNQTIYRYNYKGDNRTHIGLLAQEVEKKHPHAVGLAGGYKTVNYKAATDDAVRSHRAAGGGLMPMGVNPNPMGISSNQATPNPGPLNNSVFQILGSKLMGHGAGFSAGGDVGPENAGEAYASGGRHGYFDGGMPYGTYSGLSGGFDPQLAMAMLQGEEALGAPYKAAGSSGRVPTPVAGPSGGLALPHSPPPQQKSGLETGLETEKLISNIIQRPDKDTPSLWENLNHLINKKPNVNSGAPLAGGDSAASSAALKAAWNDAFKKAYGEYDYSKTFSTPTSDNQSGNSPSVAQNNTTASPDTSQPGISADQGNDSPPSNNSRGGLAGGRHMYAEGGGTDDDPYSQDQTGLGLKIPNDPSNRTLSLPTPPSGGGSGGGGGGLLGALGSGFASQAGSMAAKSLLPMMFSFLSTGGTADRRHHYADGGETDDIDDSDDDSNRDPFKSFVDILKSINSYPHEKSENTPAQENNQIAAPPPILQGLGAAQDTGFNKVKPYITPGFNKVKPYIIHGENGSNPDPYNAVYANGKFGNMPGGLTSHTLGEVANFQRNVLIPNTRGKIPYIAPNLGSGAVGAFQLTNATLEYYAKKLYGNNWSSIPFSPETQDQIANALYNDRKSNPKALGATWAAFSPLNPGSALAAQTHGNARNLPPGFASGGLASGRQGYATIGSVDSDADSTPTTPADGDPADFSAALKAAMDDARKRNFNGEYDYGKSDLGNYDSSGLMPYQQFGLQTNNQQNYNPSTNDPSYAGGDSAAFSAALKAAMDDARKRNFNGKYDSGNYDSSGLMPYQQFGLQTNNPLDLQTNNPKNYNPATDDPSYQEALRQAQSLEHPGSFLDNAKKGKQSSIIPILAGLAAMGTAPTRNFGVALASGLGAGVNSYQKQQEYQRSLIEPMLAPYTAKTARTAAIGNLYANKLRAAQLVTGAFPERFIQSNLAGGDPKISALYPIYDTVSKQYISNKEAAARKLSMTQKVLGSDNYSLAAPAASAAAATPFASAASGDPTDIWDGKPISDTPPPTPAPAPTGAQTKTHATQPVTKLADKYASYRILRPKIMDTPAYIQAESMLAQATASEDTNGIKTANDAINGLLSLDPKARAAVNAYNQKTKANTDFITGITPDSIVALNEIIDNNLEAAAAGTHFKSGASFAENYPLYKVEKGDWPTSSLRTPILNQGEQATGIDTMNKVANRDIESSPHAAAAKAFASFGRIAAKGTFHPMNSPGTNNEIFIQNVARALMRRDMVVSFLKEPQNSDVDWARWAADYTSKHTSPKEKDNYYRIAASLVPVQEGATWDDIKNYIPATDSNGRTIYDLGSIPVTYKSPYAMDEKIREQRKLNLLPSGSWYYGPDGTPVKKP